MNIVKLLLKLGADSNIRQAPSSRRYLCSSIPRNILPLENVIKRDKSYSLIKLLLEFGANTREVSRALYTVFNDEKLAEFRILVELGADIYAHGQRKILFKLTLESPCQEIRNFILEQGITPDMPDPVDSVGQK